MVVYFSGTGNSRYAAQMIAAGLGDGITDAAPYIKSGESAALRSEEPWVFVSPTHGWRIPRIFRDFIRSGSFTGSRRAYFVMTCGSEPGEPTPCLEKLCREKGLEFMGILGVVMPENYIAMFDVPGEEESAQIIARAVPVIRSAVPMIRAGQPFPPLRSGLTDCIKTGLVNPCFYSFCVSGRKFYATDACVGCGLCAKLCPVNAIELSDGRPVWGEGCAHCMACICGCPGKAIEYGRISLGKPRYQCAEYKPEK